MLIYAATWMDLKNIMLSERSQEQKDYILHDSLYIKFIEKSKTIEMESVAAWALTIETESVAAWALECEQRLAANRYGKLSGVGGGRVLTLTVVMAHSCINLPELNGFVHFLKGELYGM